MWAVMDHLNASLAAGTVLVIALAVLVGKQRDGVTAASRAATVTTLNATVEWIERDLTNLGSGLPAGSDAVVEAAWSGERPSFTFVTGSDTSVTAPPRVIRYERVSHDGAFELRRYEVEPSGPRLLGRSTARLRALDVVLYDGEGAQTTVPGEAGAVAVRLILAPSFGLGEPVEWSRRFTVRPSHD